MTVGDRLHGRAACVLSGTELSRRIGADSATWERFSSHWDRLAPDSYGAELGTTRLRRYGHFASTSTDGSTRLLPHGGFVQPEQSNPLYVERVRIFQPLTEAFVADPLLLTLLSLLGGVATALDDVDEWRAKVSPFRVLASADGGGDPTPEGRHRDGVTLGKQRVETIQVLRALTVAGYGWRHHPAAAMWAGPVFHRSHQSALIRKDPGHYRRHFPDVPDDLPCGWPASDRARRVPV